MRKFKKLLAMLVTAAMLLSMVPAAFAAPPGGPGGGPGGPGGMPGMSSTPTDMSGMLALKQYVFVASQGETADGEVSTACYGVYAKGEEGQAAFVPQSFSGELTVYQDKDMTEACADVEAAVNNGVFTMSGSGMDLSGNTVYYLSTGEGAYPTTIYVVNDEYSANAATLTLADGDTIQITTYAPNMAKGDYKAVVDANVIDGNTSVYLGGNRTAVSLDELTDSENYSSNREAAAWYLTSSGITNAGATMTTFGDTLYNFEYTMGIYRLFQIENKVTNTAADFVDTTDYVGAMMQNDQFSDAISGTMHSGVWNGIYTKMSEALLPGSSEENPAYLLTNIDEETRTMGFGDPVDVEFAYVGIYNAFASKWSTLNAAGEEMAAKLAEAAAAYDGAAVTAPADYTNEAKISAVATVLLGQAEAPAADKVLTKIEAVAVLYAARGCVTSRTSPDETLAERTGTRHADLSQLFLYSNSGNAQSEVQIFHDAAAAQSALNGKTFISKDNTAVLLNNIGGTVSLTNSTFGITDTKVGSWSTSDPTDSPVAVRDLSVSIDGAEAPGTPMSIPDPENGGYVYNAMGRNAYYHDGIGSGIAVWGASSVLDMTSDNGTLVLSGSNGSMSGTAFAGFGGTIKIHDAVAYSSAQHLTNILFNGTVHYEDAYALGSGRLFSSDVWGAYQVFEDTIGNGGNVTDEPTTIIAKNSVYGNSIGGNGYASQYFENSVLNVGTAGFANKTSLITDVASLTLVNSVLNNTTGTLFSIDGGANAIVTLVDSEINLPGNTLANIKSWDTINHPAFVTENPAVAPLFHSDAVVKLYGNNTITTTDGTLTASVAEGATLTIYGKVVDANGNAITIPGATIVDGEGTLVVNSATESIVFEDVNDEWFAPYVYDVARAGLMGSTSTEAALFAPLANMTRAEVATIIYRMAGQPEVSSEASFDDVEGGQWYTDAVYWAAAEGIVNGRDESTFGTFDNVTRQELVAMLYRYVKGTEENVDASASLDAFADKGDVADWAVESMQWAVGAGVINGGDNGLNPAGGATRAEVAAILANLSK